MELWHGCTECLIRRTLTYRVGDWAGAYLSLHSFGLEIGTDSDRAGEALLVACEYGHTSIVRLLLADLSVDPACIDGHHNIVRLLLSSQRVDPSSPDILIGAIEESRMTRLS